MKLKTAAVALVAALSAMSVQASAPTNVALGKVVSAQNGSFNNSLTLITDGQFLANGTSWQDASTVWWQGYGTFDIDLGGNFLISSITLQHDNNDLYVMAHATVHRSCLMSSGPITTVVG